MKKLILLAIVLLTTLSATFLDGKTIKKQSPLITASDSMLLVRLDQFDAKQYRAIYESRKNGRRILIDQR